VDEMSKKILVVDNHPAMLKFMGQLLEKEGHQVLTSENGLSALDLLKTGTPDVIFTDLIMPNIDGERLCRMVRAIPRFHSMRDLPLFVKSMRVDQENPYDDHDRRRQ
jgi:CheY-like chemotaxis protein